METLTLNQADRRRNESREFIFIGCTPHDEICTPAGYTEPGLKDGQIECKALINQLRRMYGQEPGGCEYFILENHHDFGIYHEAAIFFNCSDPDETDTTDTAFDYASKCELIPGKWDAEALQELRAGGHSQHQPAKVIKMKAA